MQRLLKAESGSLLHTERTEEFLRRKMHQDAEVQTLPLSIPSSNSSLDRRSRRDHPELQRKLSSFHQDGSPNGDQERRSPFVETPVHHQTVRQGTTRRYAFRKGDTVRISHVRQSFDREYDERWTMEYFVVDDRGMKEGIPYYTLKETFGDGVQGTFYQPELNRVKVTEQTVYRMEKVLRRRRNDALVKWMG